MASMAVNELGPMLTATEVADMLHLHVNTVKRLGDRGELRSAHAIFAVEDTQKIQALNQQLGEPIDIAEPIQPEDMPAEYKKHEWLVYTASPELRSVGWPMAIAEAQASGVGVCMQGIRPDLAEYVGEAGHLFDRIEEAAEIIAQPFPEAKREAGFEQARKSDVRGHIHRLEELWQAA